MLVLRRGIVGNGLEPCTGAAGRAVVEGATIAAVEAQAMDEAELQVGDEELAGGRIVGDIAETGAGVVLAVVLDVGEERNGTGGAVDLPDRAGTAALRHAELPGHPARAALALDEPRPPLETICRPNSDVAVEIDVGAAIGGVAVERDAEHLADVSGRCLEDRRRVGQPAGRQGRRACVKSNTRSTAPRVSMKVTSVGEHVAGTLPHTLAPEKPVTAASPRFMMASAAMAGRGTKVQVASANRAVLKRRPIKRRARVACKEFISWP